MATGDVVGSWHNTGFHGHFRSKSRLDIFNEYRHLAKPPPPEKFVNRSHCKTPRHAFSHHDNRHSFLNSALYFEEGLGRRKIENNNNNRWQPSLLHWMPLRKEIKQERPLSSVYRLDFQGSSHGGITQRLTQRPKTSYDDQGPVTTSYRYAHGRDNPNKATLSVTSNVGLTTVPNRKMRAKSTIGDGGSVASCMAWQSTSQAQSSRPRVPAATMVTMVPSSMITPAPSSVPQGNTGSISYVPHPPSTAHISQSTAPVAQPVTPAVAQPITPAVPQPVTPAVTQVTAPVPVVLAE